MTTTNLPKDHNSTKNQEIKRRLVNREVIYCVSTLVYELAQKAEEFPEYTDDLYGAFQAEPDYQEAAEAEGWTYDEEDDSYIDSEGYIDTTCSSWEDVCYGHSIDAYDYTPEVFEHWLVSNWLADKLEEHGEKVLRDFFGLTVWCRCTTGQAILLDGVISRIAEEMEILEGQANEWR